MTNSLAQASTLLCNDSELSDLTIRQIHKGEVKEYRAHKAVLCAHSSWFTKALLGNFREAGQDTIELHDDNPKYFEIMLNFFYTLEYENCVAVGLWNESTFKERVLILVELSLLAHKYDMKLFDKHVAALLEKNLSKFYLSGRQRDLLLRKHYDAAHSSKCAVCRVIAEHLVSSHFNWIKAGVTFGNTVQKYPNLSRAILIQIHKNNLFKG